MVVFLLRVERGAFFRLSFFARRLLHVIPIFFAPHRWGFGCFFQGIELFHGVVGLVIQLMDAWMDLQKTSEERRPVEQCR